MKNYEDLKKMNEKTSINKLYEIVAEHLRHESNTPLGRLYIELIQERLNERKN